jgi:sulfonate transport system substrate-binding protein
MTAPDTADASQGRQPGGTRHAVTGAALHRAAAIRSRRGRRALLAAGGIAAVLTAAACSSSSPPAASSSGSGSASVTNVSSVTLNIGDQKGTGAQALLQAAGLISKLPFKANWSDFTSGPPMLQAMGSGTVDIGGVGNAPPVFAASGGENIEVVGARETNPLGGAIVVPQNSPIHTLAQLRGKRIAISQGSSDDYHLLTVLQSLGLSTHDVTVDNLQPAEALAAFNSGNIDAWDIWSPYIEQVEAQDHARVLTYSYKYGSDYSFEVANRNAVSNPAKATAIRDYLTLLNKAYIWSDTHIQAWANIWAQATGLPNSIMLKASKDDTNTPIPVTSAVTSSEQNVVNTFYGAGLIPAKVNFSKFITTSFNSTVPGGSS